MKILHVVPTYLPAWRHGGTIWAVHGLCKALAARGHEVTVCTTNVHGTTTLNVPREAPVPIEGVTVFYFPVVRPRRLYRSPAMEAALAGDWTPPGPAGAEERLPPGVAAFDLVHIHSVFLSPTAIAARAAERAGVPYLVAPRGMLVDDLLRRRGRLRKRLRIWWAERHTLEHAAGLHATSELEKEEIASLETRLRLRLPPVHVVVNGVEAEPWTPDREAMLARNVREVLARRPLLLFLGRLSWKKGLDRLLAALVKVPRATLAVAGYDEEGWRARLEVQAKDLGIDHRVVHLGPVHGADKAALLHFSDALVLPSFSENFGNVVLEAMAAGLPVVVTPQVGLAAVVQEHRAGVVTENDPPLLAAALRDLLAEDEGRRAMGQRGAEVAAREFGWGSIAAQMEKVYGEILAGRRTGRNGLRVEKTPDAAQGAAVS